jgi:hypothetical protein
MSIFEKATRLKLRFNTLVGSVSVEDLWDLPLTHSRSTNLDSIAVALHKKLKHDENVSFVVPDRKSDETTQLAFDVVKHVIDVKLAERDLAQKERELAEKKQKIMAIIADRKDAALKDKPLEELEAMLASL